jgi:hypothetical protein
MKKLVLFFLVSFSFCSFSFGQEFSFDELVKLRSYTYPSFETYVHDKGYTLSHLEYNERCTIFKKGSNVISYCHYYDDGYSYHNHVAIKFETSSKAEYERIKQQVTSSLQYYKTKLRRFTNQHYLEHIYVNDAISVHMYDISYRDDDKPYYEIEVYSIYAAY